MKLVVTTKGKSAVRINRFFEFVLYIISYTIAFLISDVIFDSFLISNDYKSLYSVLAVGIIYLLDKAVKPILITLTMPITGLTFGLFYFVINTLILKLTDWIMGPKLNFTDIWILFFIAIVISFINFLIENFIIKPLIRKAKKKWIE